MASTPTPVKVTEVYQVTPPESASELTLSLTFFDTLWFKFHPVERIFFYQLTADSSFFYSSIIPQLKHTLSLTLLHFRLLAGNLIWPSDSPKPVILYTSNDAVSFTVAESDADFHLLSGATIHEAADSHHYIPELSVSETKAAIVSFQITLFPNKGFSIGVSSHHAISDGKSIIMFLKAWAHISKHNTSLLPPELTPFLDRTIIQDPEGIDMVYLNDWITLAAKMGTDSNPTSLKLIPITPPSDIKLVRGTFRLSGEDVKKLREKVISAIGEGNYSTFVLTYAYVAINMVKSKGIERNMKLGIGFMADCRSRLNPPVLDNYFGNCVIPHGLQTEAGLVMEEDGFVFLVGKLKETMKKIEKGVMDGAKDILSDYLKAEPDLMETIGVAGGNRFGVYGTDFGWGRPEMVEVTSVDRTGAFSMAETKHGNGVEIGLAMAQNQMEIFSSLFINGLK
ncbi:phenolic glucoside malonyltransferase 1-like [Euphorbia lathyris]|uniref:phenolic glucoside malonyltransferase 1-like n=1 Tax=Euphorbia lathyris TaxID=212925 RepID=UPI003313A2E5